MAELIGIAGGIGSGKSVVSRILRLEGNAVYDCDWEAGELMHTPEVRASIVEICGPSAYDGSGRLNRKWLGGCLFADSEMRLAVNEAVHRAVRQHLSEWCAARNDRQFLFVESAILLSSGLAALCDKVWLVDAPVDMRIERAMSRSNLTREEVEKRILVQNAEITANTCIEGVEVKIIENGAHSSVLDRIHELLEH